MNGVPLGVKIGHSPDPDDAFMFYALTSEAIDTGGRDYEHVLVDIATLNSEAKEGTYEVSAVSIGSFPEISDKYALMNCGASMGEGYGPMVISRSPMSLDEVKKVVIAIPGKSTSAYLTLRLALGDVDVQEVPFDEILPRVLSGEFEAGVIIHEGQLTWGEEGANLVIDLGVWWNDSTGLPLPLGGNVVRRDVGLNECEAITNDVRRSIEHALENPGLALEFAKKWGRGIDDDTNERFVKMYVNERTVDYGAKGREAVRLFLRKGQEIGMVREDFDVEAIDFIGA
ncbi:MAG: ABC transporter substrate-binding protein [Candidatus Thalassarchaeum sp.]|nr:ABC transporter substrate-binding protein [Candidatus Thalassarchaeum sp.]